jgi:chondroitin AC lyase
VGYVFPQTDAALVSLGPRSGSWAEINSLKARTPVTKNVFALWLDHGMRPKNASYQYIVIPGSDRKRLSDYAARPFVQILANTSNVQAVKHERLGISEIIFYSPGQLSLGKDLSISVDQPCMVMLREGGATIEITASAPRGPMELHLSLAHAAKIKTVTFALSGGPMLGASQVRSIVWP